VARLKRDSPKTCRRCGQPIVLHAEDAEVFEGMHWLCFHLENEHDADPDEACSDPSCPWFRLEVFRKALVDNGLDPEAILLEAIKVRYAR
jgi:hypothetical protein